METEVTMADRALEQSLELNRIQADMLKDRSKSNRWPWIAFSIVLVALLATNFIWIQLWSQYDTISSYEANGLYAIVDSNGNIISQDISDAEMQAFKDWWVTHGDSQSDKGAD